MTIKKYSSDESARFQIDMDCPKPQTTEYRHGIHLKNWDAVETALRTYGGATSGTAETHNAEAFAESDGAIASSLFLSLNGVGLIRFIDEMLQEAKGSIDKYGKWHKSYDYDGIGPFHKSSISIEKGPSNDGFHLDLSVAFLGKKPEDELATQLGLEKALDSKTISFPFNVANADDNHVKIDMDQTMQMLRTSDELRQIIKKRLSGASVTSALREAHLRYEPVEIVLGTKDGIDLVLKFSGIQEDRISVEKGDLLMPISVSYQREKRTPQICFSVRPSNKLATSDPGKQKTMNKIVGSIEATCAKITETTQSFNAPVSKNTLRDEDKVRNGINAKRMAILLALSGGITIAASATPESVKSSFHDAVTHLLRRDKLK